MSRVRSYRQHWLLGPALAISALVQVAVVAGYQALKPVPPPPPWRLSLAVDGAGEGTLLVSMLPQLDGRGTPIAAGRLLGRCDSGQACNFEVPRDRFVSLVAVRGDKMTFEGWVGCVGYEEDILTCEAPMVRDREVVARFGKMPEELEVAWIEPAATPDIALPKLPVPKPPPPPIEAEKLEEDQVAVAVPPPPPPDVPPPVIPPPPPPPPEDKPPPPPVVPPPSNLRMVEVPDENEVKEAPDDATHLSDKNRDVAEETAAKETNLEKQLEGKTAPSQESPDTTSPEVGGPDDKIAQLEHAESELTDRERDSDHSGESETAKGQILGEAGEDGQDGDGGDPNPGMFAMRGIGGRGSLLDQKRGDGKRVGPKGIPGLNAPLAMDDYERIIGKEKSDKEKVLAKARLSGKKGRWERKLEAIKSSLENFTPDVRTGNQTALKTRASPFAVYVARMHRRIHELWGFGFLAHLDGESSSHPLNNFDLYTVIEASLNPDGTVHKTTITHASGKLEFDVAAIDTILSAAPYEETPEIIRSSDGRVYLRWGFYRNWRQCGTFNVEPYILTDIPNAEPLDDGAALKAAKPQRGVQPLTPAPSEAGSAPKPVSGDKQASYAANMWVAGFTSASTARMLRVSALPFTAGAAVAAENQKDLKEVYEGLLVESGTFKDFAVVSTGDFTNKTGVAVPGEAGTLVLLVRASKATFGVILTPTRSGEYRATGIAR